MRIHSSFLLSALAACMAVATAAAQAPNCPSGPVADHGKPMPQNGDKLASPAATASTQLGTSTITLKYNAPSVRCRVIFGGLVPYGKVWRTGANPATSLHTDIALKIGTIDVPAGDYTIYSLPEQGKPWMLIINKQTGQWGTVYKPEMDLGRTPMKSAPQKTSQEVMTLGFEHTTQSTTQLHIRWDKVDEFVNVTAAQ